MNTHPHYCFLFFFSKPIPTSQKPPSLLFLLKVSKVQVSTRHYQEKMVAEALDLLLKHYNIFSYSIAFPELVLPTKLALKKYKNTTHIHRVRKQVSVFLERIERNVTFIQVLNPLKDTLGHFSHFHGPTGQHDSTLAMLLL